VNVKAFGAKGDGTSDDTQAFAEAIQSHDKIFVPKGNYRLTGTLTGPKTQLFGLTPGRSIIGGGASVGKRGRGPDAGDSFVLATVDDAQSAPASPCFECKAAWIGNPGRERSSSPRRRLPSPGTAAGESTG
jgi:hypothetical protein